MHGILNHLQLAFPEITVLITACVSLLAHLFLGKRYPNVTLTVSIIGLALAGAQCLLLLGQFNTLLFHGAMLSDDMGYLSKFFILLCVVFSFVYSQGYLRDRQMPESDYYVLGLFSTLGMMLLVAAHSLLTIYLSLELLSLPLSAMIAIRRVMVKGSEAAMKFFVMSAIASAFLLYGMSLLYAATGQLDLHVLVNAIALNWDTQHLIILFALVFIAAGLGFKLAAAPFHVWVPDVYEGAPTPVTLFISAGPKIAAIIMTLRLLTYALFAASPAWEQIILVLALFSTGLGNLVAIVQTNLKRLFAYSAISHMGYSLFGILAGHETGYAAALYYVIIYAVMSLGAFGLLTLISRSGLEIESMDDLKGLNQRNPWLAFLMMIILFSMAGVPPTVGFFAKFLVLKALIDVHLIWVAVLGVLFAVIGAFYYLRVVKVMYFDEPVSNLAYPISKPGAVLLSANALLLVYWGIFPSGLIQHCADAMV